VLYFDSSALVKLVIIEVESYSLRSWIAARKSEARVSSAVACVEVPRAVRRYGSDPVAAAYRLFTDRIHLVELTFALMDTAAHLNPEMLHSLDAIHLASALRLGAGLTALVAYDKRLLEAATAAGIPTVSPGA